MLAKLQNWLKTGDTSKSINKTCHDPAKDLVDCMSATECFESGHNIRYCANNDKIAQKTCNKQLQEYYLCRRFTVDHSKHWVKDTYKEMALTPFFTKSNPRVVDYNPILHTSFYTQFSNKSLFSNRSFSAEKQENTVRSQSSVELYNRRRERSPMIRQAAKKVVMSERMYKTKPRNIFSDPITGVVKEVNLPRKSFESFDVVINKIRFPRSEVTGNPELVGEGEKERISGALRKEVPETTYVNPYELKHYREPSPVERPDFQRAAMKFYGSEVVSMHEYEKKR